MKNAEAPAVKREEEEWGKKNGDERQEQDHTQQAGHSYPINPGSLSSGAILTTSSIMVLHLGHA
jgi:hypothetical protein